VARAVAIRRRVRPLENGHEQRAIDCSRSLSALSLFQLRGQGTQCPVVTSVNEARGSRKRHVGACVVTEVQQQPGDDDGIGVGHGERACALSRSALLFERQHLEPRMEIADRQGVFEDALANRGRFAGSPEARQHLRVQALTRALQMRPGSFAPSQGALRRIYP